MARADTDKLSNRIYDMLEAQSFTIQDHGLMRRSMDRIQVLPAGQGDSAEGPRPGLGA